MKKTLPALSLITAFCMLMNVAVAQGKHTVTAGSATAPANFPVGTGCLYNWVNNTPGIGLPASGTGNIASFTAINNGSKPVTATITATPAPAAAYGYIGNATSNSVSVFNVLTNSVVATIP